jgi:hypothetical protein
MKLGQLFVQNIMKDFEEIPNSNGMKFLRDVVDLETAITDNVVLRNITEDYWRAVIDTAQSNRVCASGTPGIGKTITTCILIRLLLQERKTVIYNVRTKQENAVMYVFTPSNDSDSNLIGVSIMEARKFNQFDEKYESTYYVVDPGKTKDDCDLSLIFLGKVIIVASLDDRHWGESEFTKRRRLFMGKFLYFPVWEEWELFHLAPYMKNKICRDEIQRRFVQFGGVPRYIFESDLTDVIDKQKDAITNLSAQTVLTIISTDRSNVQTSASKIPRGILLSYKLHDSSNFTKFYTELASEHICDRIASKYMNVLWSQILSNQRFDPMLFEAYCRQLIHGIERNGTWRFIIREAKAKKKDEAHILEFTTLSTTLQMERVDDILTSAKGNSSCLYYPSSVTNKLIDFIFHQDNTFHMFQATIGATHTANPLHMVEILLLLIKDRHDWLLHDVGYELELSPMFIFYYMVPDFRFSTFATIKVNASLEALSQFAKTKCGDGLGKDTILFRQWTDVVKVYILKVPQPQESNAGRVRASSI